MPLSSQAKVLMTFAALQLILSTISFAVGIWYTGDMSAVGSPGFWYELCLHNHRWNLALGFEVAARTNPQDFPKKHKIWRAALCSVLIVATISDLGIFQGPVIVRICSALLVFIVP
ncbi:hypothetical protein N431DRAFT_475170 [Stipitochalara longipes BDJ]|nr:hypothetical protein N431DRAFT_475170 [Stipitochalara longipes BDJ]